MKKLFLSVAALALAVNMFASDEVSGDQVLMTVNGRDVKVSEFKYLFEKNNAQQLKPQSIDDYVGMFIDYKLKVADAENAGIDTTATFRAEYNKFRDELAAPYLVDKSVEEALLNEALSHLNREVNVSHIMVGGRGVLNSEARVMLDSIRTAIVNGDITFEDAAAKYSVDRATAQKGGLMGWLPASRYPWTFEKTAYDTKVGGISPVIDSGFGFHIVKVNADRPSRGQVKASHILKMTRDVPEDQLPAQKHAIDSIYELLVNGADFATVAMSESQDPGSAAKGGDLGWFGSGIMVAEFDSVAFALPDGAISKPFTTPFGYHIIKRFGHRDMPADEAREMISVAMTRDGRAAEPRNARIRQLKEKYGAVSMMANKMGLRHRLSSVSVVDSTLIQALAADPMPMERVGENVLTLSQVVANLPSSNYPDGAALADALERTSGLLVDNAVIAQAISDLADENSDYRNLINEYRDGILLFEISNQNVWDRAAKDKKGLEECFRKNASHYKWDAPRFKGMIIFSQNDSIVDEVIAYADGLGIDDPEALVADVRNHFGKNVKIERVIAAKGENPITDYLAFGGEKPAAKSAHWSAYKAYRGKVIDKPEEAADVRGMVTTDYQGVLEQQWLKQLRKKYPVTVNKKVLSAIKKSEK